MDAAQDRRSQQFADEAPAAGAVSGGAIVREQFAECWCRCSCGKFRLVERHCMDSLSSDAFCKGQATCRSWSAWLEGAESRYDEFVAEQARATDREAALREFGAPTVDAAFGADQHAGACAEGVAADARPAEGGADSDGAPPLHRFMLQLHHLRTWPCHDQFQKLAGVYHIVGDRDVRSLRNISIAILRNKLLNIVLERWWLWKVDEAMTREFDEIDLWSDEEDSK